MIIDTVYLSALWCFSSPCSSHIGLSALAKTYQESLHLPFAWNTGPQLSASSHHHSRCSYDGTFSQKASLATLPQVPHQSHSITSSVYLLRRLITLLFMCLLVLCLSPLEDKLQEEKFHLTRPPALLQYLAHNTHLTSICWIDKQKA